jgi:hypothetical protein
MSKPIKAVSVRLKPRWRWAAWFLRKHVWIKIHHHSKQPTWAMLPMGMVMRVSKADGITFVHAVDRVFCTIVALRGELPV